MSRTLNETTNGTDLGAGFSAGRCLWDESVCTDTPTHFVTFSEAGGVTADVFCVRHYVLALARLCQLHLPDCTGDFAGHVTSRGVL